MKQKVNYNRKPFIILICIAVAFLLAAVLCIVVPMILPKPEAPVKVTSDIELVYSRTYDEYSLRGEITNVSGERVVIKNDGGMVVYCSNSDDNFTHGWYKDYSDIVLEPNESYDFDNCRFALGGGDSTPRVTRVKVDIDGTTYYLVGSDSLPMFIAIICGVFALVFFIVAITQKNNQKNKVMQGNAVQDLCATTGEPSFIISGNLTDKNEQKKAAAKNAGWAAGAVLSSLFLGVGYFRVSSGTSAMNFVLSEHALYSISNGAQGAGLVPITRDDFHAASIQVKKKKVIIKSVDGIRTITLFHDKKLPVTVEQVAQYLNNIFFAPLPEAAAAPISETATTADPFDDVPAATAAEAKEISAEPE
ncbi:MAG: hypothetical protein K2O67_00040, partial [Clostridia bacterium]|nr:hypothetical protein [Clostridia bacterium]